MVLFSLIITTNCALFYPKCCYKIFKHTKNWKKKIAVKPINPSSRCYHQYFGIFVSLRMNLSSNTTYPQTLHIYLFFNSTYIYLALLTYNLHSIKFLHCRWNLRNFRTFIQLFNHHCNLLYTSVTLEHFLVHA